MAPLITPPFPSSRRYPSLFCWGIFGLLSFLLCHFLSTAREAQSGLFAPLQIQDYGDIDTRTMQEVATGRSFQRLREEKGAISAEYGFVNFNNDLLQISYSFPAISLARYRQNYGYTQADLDALVDWQKKSLAEAYAQAVQNRWTQEKLDVVSRGIEEDFRKKQEEFFAARGFRLKKGNILIPDIPEIVRRNIKPLYSVARQFDQTAAANRYDSQEIIASVLSMVQTALHYRNLPADQDGRITGGMTPPLVTLLAGEGDCDTKTALLAAILRSWSQIKLIGVAVPNHYLVGVLQHPAKGQAFVEYEGRRYVLLEPAGPAWLPPGMIAESTMVRLAAGDDLRLEAL